MDRDALAHTCARIERAGGSVREYLQGLGCISPWGTWFRLQIEELGRARYQITDGKGGADMKKITLADKKKAVDIALKGGNPLVFLKECGSKNPSATWYAIKQTLKETDPETYERLPDLRKKEESREEAAEPVIMPADDQGKPEIGKPEMAPEPEPIVNLTIKSEDLKNIEHGILTIDTKKARITKPVNYGGFDVMALKDPETGDSFVWDEKHGRMDWRNCVGEEVSMTPEAWRKLIKNLPQIMEIFGI